MGLLPPPALGMFSDGPSHRSFKDRQTDQQCSVRRPSNPSFPRSRAGGDDVDEVFEAIHCRFGTDFSELPFTDYFPQEHEALGAHLKSLIGIKTAKRPLTVEHLVAVVRRGQWFEP